MVPCFSPHHPNPSHTSWQSPVPKAQLFVTNSWTRKLQCRPIVYEGWLSSLAASILPSKSLVLSSSAPLHLLWNTKLRCALSPQVTYFLTFAHTISFMWNILSPSPTPATQFMCHLPQEDFPGLPFEISFSISCLPQYAPIQLSILCAQALVDSCYFLYPASLALSSALITSVSSWWISGPT